MSYIKLLRPSHYTKNLFLFLPLFFSGNIFEWDMLIRVLAGFCCFSFMASVVYIINDVRDVESDRIHPEKKYRPIASGKVPVTAALVIGVVLLAGSVTAAYMLDIRFLITLGVYFVLNLMYSLGLKQISVVDISILSTGFLLRVISGGILADVEISHWILIMTFLLAFFLGLAKRRDDVVIFMESGQRMRKSVEGYNLEFINASMVIMGAVVIVAYIMYTISEDVIERLGTDKLFATSFFVILGIIRYLQITFVKQKSGNPTKVFLKDTVLQFIMAGWVISYFVILYAKYIDLPWAE